MLLYIMPGFVFFVSLISPHQVTSEITSEISYGEPPKFLTNQSGIDEESISNSNPISGSHTLDKTTGITQTNPRITLTTDSTYSSSNTISSKRRNESFITNTFNAINSSSTTPEPSEQKPSSSDHSKTNKDISNYNKTNGTSDATYATSVTPDSTYSKSNTMSSKRIESSIPNISNAIDSSSTPPEPTPSSSDPSKADGTSDTMDATSDTTNDTSVTFILTNDSTTGTVSTSSSTTTSPSTESTASTSATTENTTESTIDVTTGSNTDSTSESNTDNTTESNTDNTTESTTDGTESNTDVTTGSNTDITTGSNTDVNTGSTTVSTMESTIDVTTGSNTDVTTGSNTDVTTGSTIDITTESTTLSPTESNSTAESTVITLESTTFNSSESTTVSTTESTTDSTTGTTNVSTTESTTLSPTESTVITPESTTFNSSESTTVSTTESTTASTTESTTASTTESTTASTTESTTASTTESTTVSTTESSTVSTTQSTTEDPTTPEIPNGVAVEIVAGILGILLLGGLMATGAVMYRRGKLPWNPKNSHASVRPQPISVSKFENHCNQLLETPARLGSEYQLLLTLSTDVSDTNTFAAAQLPDNKKKNRYVNILPYDLTRVKLDITNDDPSSDYINASFIKGISNTIEYIASQGPKEETVPDFWRMIYQHDVQIIVMVTNLEEGGKVKCDPYLPKLREQIFSGDLIVRCGTELHFPMHTQRTIVLHKDDKKRNITHLHFNEWPDFGCPEGTDSMLQFCRTLRHHVSTSAPGLVLVHCSAGVGRTGTLIAIDILLQHIQESKKVDVFGTVFKLRKQRTNMVQTMGQYAYIYKCIKDAVRDPSFFKPDNSPTNSLEPIYENVPTKLTTFFYEKLPQIKAKSTGSSESECEL